MNSDQERNPYESPRTVSRPAAREGVCSIGCRCGRAIDVGLGMAGAEIACQCGNVVSVPGVKSQRARRSLLRRVPQYQLLLDQYPKTLLTMLKPDR